MMVSLNIVVPEISFTSSNDKMCFCYFYFVFVFVIYFMSKSDTFTYMLTNWAAWWCSGHCFVTAERSWFLIQAGASPLLHRFSLSAPASSFSPKVCWEVTGGSKLVIGVKVGLKGISGKKVDKFCFTSTCKTQMFKDSVLSYHTISYLSYYLGSFGFCKLTWNKISYQQGRCAG